MKMKTKIKTKIKNKNRDGNEKQNQKKKEFSFSFLFCFSFSFWLLFLLFKSFCIFVKSTWPRGAIDGQLSLTWLRSAIAFSFAKFSRGLVVP